MSPMGRQEIVSPVQQAHQQEGPQNEQAFANRMQSPPPQYVQPPPQTWQQMNPMVNQNFGSSSRLAV